MPKVQPGDPIRIKASDWNRLQALAGGNAGEVVLPAIDLSQQRGLYVPIKNDSGSTVNRFHVLGISGVVVSETDNLQDFKNNWTLTGDTPDSDCIGKFVVMQETVEDGRIGTGLVQGVTVAEITVNHADHDRVDIDTGGDSKLSSQFYGAGRILYKPSGTGTKWAIVDIGSFESPELKAVADEAISVDGSGDAVVQRNGSDSETITAHLNWMDGSESVSDEDELLVRFFPDENKYVIIGAEC